MGWVGTEVLPGVVANATACPNGLGHRCTSLDITTCFNKYLPVWNMASLELA
jgi:hypothetical protein